ncbi:MAG: thiol:disulfide interchange protein DsbA/DsbL [Pseudomonadales bacterium]|nr:thiol:disulfide interchange protein DsbA/DsbL [Pseudomonadales bacterium]
MLNKIKALPFILIAGFLMLSHSVSAAGIEQYEAGTHYVELQIPLKTRKPNKVEVAEYFSYGCNHCYNFEPLIAVWHNKLSDDVEFVRTPAIWNKDYQVYAQTYYTAKALKVLDKIHTPLFNAIQNRRQRLNSPQAMADFFQEHGVDVEGFAKAYNSFGVRASVQQAEAKGRAYRSGGVPAIIVNGKYRIEGSMAGSNVNMLRIADYLIEKERKLLIN